MKRTGKTTSPGTVLATALTWDGARVSIQELPAAARKFLGTGVRRLPARPTLGALFAQDGVREIRVCWLPRLQGGENVLTDPFHTTGRRRLGFRILTIRIFGEVLGVVYRRGPGKE